MREQRLAERIAQRAKGRTKENDESRLYDLAVGRVRRGGERNGAAYRNRTDT
jgi:hypothetical protein